MKKFFIALTCLLATLAPAAADVVVKNQSKVTSFVVLANKPIKKQHHALLKKFDYAGFRKHYPDHKIEQVGSGSKVAVPWPKKGDGLIMTYVTGAVKVQQFLPFKLKANPTNVLVKDAKKSFHVVVSSD